MTGSSSTKALIWMVWSRRWLSAPGTPSRVTRSPSPKCAGSYICMAKMLAAQWASVVHLTVGSAGGECGRDSRIHQHAELSVYRRVHAFRAPGNDPRRNHADPGEHGPDGTRFAGQFCLHSHPWHHHRTIF